MSVPISIIVPMYNAEETIYKCLSSILCQSFSNFELILVDDGSIDKTLEICRTYMQKDCRIKLFSKKNGGVSSARNMGLDLAEGDYIVFIDSDDTVDPFHLEQLYQKGCFDFVTGGYITQGPDGTWHEHVFCDESTTRMSVASSPTTYLGKYYFGVTCAKLYKKSIIDQHGLRFPINVHNGEDSQFIFRFLKHVSTIRIVPCCGYNYFYYPSSLAHRVHTSNFEWRIQVEQLIMDFFAQCSGYERDWLNSRCFDVLMGQVREHFPHIKEQVYTLYKNELFTDAIDLQAKNKSFKKHLFIWTMTHNCYGLFTWYEYVCGLCIRAKNKIKRTFSAWGKHDG